MVECAVVYEHWMCCTLLSLCALDRPAQEINPASVYHRRKAPTYHLPPISAVSGAPLQSSPFKPACIRTLTDDVALKPHIGFLMWQEEEEKERCSIEDSSLFENSANEGESVVDVTLVSKCRPLHTHTHTHTWHVSSPAGLKPHSGLI